MKAITALLVTGSLLALLSGCTAHKHNKAGDAAAAGGDMNAAFWHYGRALEHDESLSRDRRFMDKYAAAEARVAYQEAVRLREQGEYEQSAEQLRRSIAKDASYAEPGELLGEVLVEASATRYVRAVAAADLGKRDIARLHLERALQQNPRNTLANAALSSLMPGDLPGDTQGLAEYREAMQYTADKRWPEAVQMLKKAVTMGPSLLPARLSLHDAQRELANTKRLTTEAEALINERSIGPALDRLQRATEIWPFNERAGELTQQAQRLRSDAEAKLAQATDLAGKRKWEQAIAMAEAALSIDRSHAGARKSLNQFKQAAASDYVEHGEELLEQGKLLEAERSFGRATELDIQLKPASAGLKETRARLGKARSLTRAGAGHIEVLQMSGAILSLNQSLTIWPFNHEAQNLLAHAKAEQEKARQRFTASARFADAGAWDQAITIADEALALDRSYNGLAEHRRQLPRRAAADYTQQGDTSLADNKLDKARSGYDKAMSYVPDYGPARSGMASTYLASGKAHEAKKRYGAALLDYTLGRSYQSKHAVSEAWATARHLVQKRVGMGIGVEVDPGRGGVVDPGQLARSLGGELGQYNTRGLEVGGKAPPYTLLVTIGRAEIDTRRTGSVNRTHGYFVSEQRPNQAYAKAQRHLDEALSDLRACQAAYDRAACDYDDAKRRADRLNPGPAPRRPATIGTESHDAEAQAEHQRQLSAHKRKVQAYRNAQSHARSLASKRDSLYRTLSSREREVRSCKRRLANTPKLVWVDIPYTWNYTVETYKKTGDLTVTSQLIDNTTGKKIGQASHHADFTDTDTMRLNANPDIGLRRDSLVLASDSKIRSALTSDLANDASPWAVQAGVKHRLDSINESIRQLELAKDQAGALEARVDAAVLIRVVDPAGSLKQLDGLAERYAAPAE